MVSEREQITVVGIMTAPKTPSVELASASSKVDSKECFEFGLQFLGPPSILLHFRCPRETNR